MTLHPLILEVALPIFLATVLTIIAVWRLATPVRSPIDSRLQALGHTPAPTRRDLRARWSHAWSDVAENAAGRWGWKRGGALEISLRQAGFRGESAVLTFRLSQLVITAVGVALAIAWGALQALPLQTVILVTCLWGYVLFSIPAVAVRWRATERKRAIAEGLPGALDLVVVCLEAGLGLDAAFVRVAAEIVGQNPILGGELLSVSREVQAGVSRREALRHLADRTGVPEVTSLVAIMAQTERLGTSIAQALRAQAEASRVRQRQRVEEQAAKTAVKMVFPLAFCIFPAMFVVILGPAMIGVVRLFRQLGG